jgi:xylan 1,4-beta-xylosidase
MPRANNPILTGFNADPSICRAGEDYYIATSTFDWYPGVQISHSRDLVHWKVVSRPLDRLSQLDLRGNQNSGGVWAPCLTWADGQFWLIYTDMKRWTGPFKDGHNYLVTSPTIEGPWSEPVYLNSSGFDPSLFHGPDGRKWLVNMIWDARPNHNPFGGIVLQQFDPQGNRLTGPVTRIFGGSPLGLVEGPHLTYRDGWHYLVTAEGGTFSTHATTVARSKLIEGPYELMPGNPLITSSDNPGLRLQSAGHGSLVELPDGSWYLAHLCRRPAAKGRSILGRETALQKIRWDQDGWPRLADGGHWPHNDFEAPALPTHPWAADAETDGFDGPRLALAWQSWRTPLTDEVCSLSARPGWLRLYGRESILSVFRQSLVARRQTAFHIEAETTVDIQPGDFQHAAGLVAFYSTDNFYYLFVTKTDHAPRAIGLMACEKGQVTYPVEKEYPVAGEGPIGLKLEIDGPRLRFWYRAADVWAPVGWELDASILSDEHAVPCGFTGNFVGVACQDLSGQGRTADFAEFRYQVLGTKS